MSEFPLIKDISIVQWTLTFCLLFQNDDRRVFWNALLFSKTETRFLKLNSDDYFQKNTLIKSCWLAYLI